MLVWIEVSMDREERAGGRVKTFFFLYGRWHPLKEFPAFTHWDSRSEVNPTCYS